jgi:4-hydroxybenzoate polyprenyltransferase
MKLNSLKPYLNLMRLHQPAGIFLLLWPCLIGLSLAERGDINISLTIVFIIGSILMRGAGCIINDLVDRDIDISVARTKDRLITSGKITTSKAIKFLSILLALSTSLLFFLNKEAIIICLSSMALVVLYPFCKRFTYWPQLCLGLVFNVGALVGWVSVRGDLSTPPIALYIACLFWTLGYDTIYAAQDREDDLKLGVKSTALKFGEKTSKYVNWFYTITATMFVYAGSSAGMHYNFYMLTILPIILLFWQVNTLNIDNPSNCARRFKSNIIVGGLMFLATIMTRLI